MHRAYAPPRLAGSDPELEHRADLYPLRRRRRLLLELHEVRDLRAHQLEVRVGVPPPLRHGNHTTSYSRDVHFGVILPNYGGDATPDAIRRTAEKAEEFGFDSVWTTEHIIVGPEAYDPYGRGYDPLVTLGCIAGWPECVALCA